MGNGRSDAASAAASSRAAVVAASSSLISPNSETRERVYRVFGARSPRIGGEFLRADNLRGESGARGGFPRGGVDAPHVVEELGGGVGTERGHRVAHAFVRLGAFSRVLVQGSVERDGTLGIHAEVQEAERIQSLELGGDRAGAHVLDHALELGVRHHGGRSSVDVGLGRAGESRGGAEGSPPPVGSKETSFSA